MKDNKTAADAYCELITKSVHERQLLENGLTKRQKIDLRRADAMRGHPVPLGSDHSPDLISLQVQINRLTEQNELLKKFVFELMMRSLSNAGVVEKHLSKDYKRFFETALRIFKAEQTGEPFVVFAAAEGNSETERNSTKSEVAEALRGILEQMSVDTAGKPDTPEAPVKP